MRGTSPRMTWIQMSGISFRSACANALLLFSVAFAESICWRMLSWHEDHDAQTTQISHAGEATKET